MDSLRVLILGEKNTAQILANQFQKKGLRPQFLDQVLDKPRKSSFRYLPAHPKWIDEFRPFLEAFADQTRGRGWIHPGSTLWAERADLVSCAEQLGLTVVAPSKRCLNLFSNSLHFLTEVARLRFPHRVIWDEPLHSVRELERWREKSRVDSSWILRSVRACGGAGYFFVQNEEDLKKKLPIWLEQLTWQVGDSLFFIEKAVEGARRLSLPFVRFQGGFVQFFPIVDFSLQVGFQRRVGLVVTDRTYRGKGDSVLQGRVGPSWVQKAQSQVRQFLDEIQYVGYGALDFIVDGDSFHWLEGTPRLNTEFHLLERMSGFEVVEWQLAALREEKPSRALLQSLQPFSGVGASIRLEMREPLLNLPRFGKVFEGEGRVCSGPVCSSGQASEVFLRSWESEGASETPSLVGQIFAFATSRKKAFQLLQQELDAFWLAGEFQTTESFLRETLSHPWVQEGMFHQRFLEEDFIPRLDPPLPVLEFALQHCSLSAPESEGSSGLDSSGLGRRGEMGWWFNDSQVIRLKSNPREDREVGGWVVPPHPKWIEGQRTYSGICRVGQKQWRAFFLECPDRWVVRVGSWTFTLRPRQMRVVDHVVSLVSGKVHAFLFRPGALIPAREPQILIESEGRLIPHALVQTVQLVQWQVALQEEVRFGQILGTVKPMDTRAV